MNAAKSDYKHIKKKLSLKNSRSNSESFLIFFTCRHLAFQFLCNSEPFSVLLHQINKKDIHVNSQ